MKKGTSSDADTKEKLPAIQFIFLFPFNFNFNLLMHLLTHKTATAQRKFSFAADNKWT